MPDAASPDAPWYETVVLPALIRAARNAYGQAMRRALEAGGFDDLPRNGLFLIGGLALAGGRQPLKGWGRALGTSKQGVSQLVDTLVLRGYVERLPDPQDRRRLDVALTEHGWAAARLQQGARDSVDAELAAAVPPEDLIRTRRTLAVLADIGAQRARAAGEGDEA